MTHTLNLGYRVDTINSNMVNPIEKLAWRIQNNAVSEKKVNKINKKIDHIKKAIEALQHSSRPHHHRNQKNIDLGMVQWTGNHLPRCIK